MEKLADKRKEEFCRLVALEDCDVADAAYRAGYGVDRHPNKDSYHALQGNRLINQEKIQLRINTLREQHSKEDSDFTIDLLTRLKKIVSFDYGKYYDSANVALNNGRTVTDFFLKKGTSFKDWDGADRQLMINGFDSNGRPKFVDKQWALEKLLKIYNLDGKSGVDVEDLLSLFTGAGLGVGLTPPISDPDEEYED